MTGACGTTTRAHTIAHSLPTNGQSEIDIEDQRDDPVSMSAEALASWLFGVMIATVPPGKIRYPAEARETPEQTRARYADIASALAQVALDPNEKPVWVGPLARERSA